VQTNMPEAVSSDNTPAIDAVDPYNVQTNMPEAVGSDNTPAIDPVDPYGHVVRNAALERDDLTVADSANRFIELCATQWNEEIAGGARRVLQSRKMNKPKLLPLAADVKKLDDHPKDVVKRSMTVIEKRDAGFVEEFRSLAEAMLALLILFNRRRQGEVSRLTIAQYLKAAEVQRQPTDVDSSLSPLERHLLSVFHRIEIPGKRNRCVRGKSLDEIEIGPDDRKFSLTVCVNL